MNLFYLDDNIEKCAQYHNNSHCSKMILEYTQLLSTCIRIQDGKEFRYLTGYKTPYKFKTLRLLSDERVVWIDDENKFIINEYTKHFEYLSSHEKHPVTLWLLKSKSHWLYLQSLGMALYDEFQYRYQKKHMSGEIIRQLKPPMNLEDHGFTDPPCSMPDECKVYDEKHRLDVVESYRRYYNLHKQHIAKWSKREIPYWFECHE